MDAPSLKSNAHKVKLIALRCEWIFHAIELPENSCLTVME